MNIPQFLLNYFRSKLNSKVWEVLAKLVKKRRKKQFSEKLSRHLEPNGVFIIRRRPPGAGLFSNVNHVIQGLLRAEELNLIPIVDMKNYWTIYNRPYKIADSFNSWNYFFTSVSCLDLDKINRKKNISLSAGDKILTNHWLTDKSAQYVLNNNLYNEVSTIIHSKIKLNIYCLRLLADTKKIIDYDPANTLAVSYRGTDYSITKPFGHSRQPLVGDVLAEIKKKMNSYKFKRILICSEDTLLWEAVKNLYGEIIYNNFRLSANFLKILKTNIPGVKTDDNEIVRAYGYLIETYLMSEANDCIASIANGAAFSFLLNNNSYANPKIFGLGRY